MKRKTSKILGLILAVLMLVGLLPVSALAATKYDLWVGDTQVTSANAADILRDGTASYNAATKTLTLNGFSYEGNGGNIGGEGVYAVGELTINLVGDNTITGNTGVPAILLRGDLTITGSGTLTARTALSGGLGAIHANEWSGYDGDILIKDTTVTATGDDGFAPYGIFARDNVRIENSKVKVSSGKAEYTSYAICGEGGGIDIINSTVEVKAARTKSTGSCALYSGNTRNGDGGDINITRSKVALSAGDIGIENLYDDNIIITNSELIISVENDDNDIWGIYGSKALTVTNSDVDITLNSRNKGGIGISSRDGFTITESNVNVKAGNWENNLGVYVPYGDILLEKRSNVTITCGDAQCASSGIFNGENRIIVNDSNLTVSTGDSKNVEKGRGYGIISYGQLELVNAKVNVDAGKSTSDSGYGVCLDKGLSVDAKSVLKVTQAGGSTAENIGICCYSEMNIKGKVYTAAGKPSGQGKSFGIIGNGTGWPEYGLLEAKGYTMAVANLFYELQKVTVIADSIIAGASYDGSDAKPIANTGDKATLEVTEKYKYVKAESKAPAIPEEPTGIFKDVKAGAWYYDAVKYAVEKGLMNGIGDGKFDPNGNTTRAMIVTILYRLEGKSAVSAKSPFSDAKDGQWYANAVIWANEKGIVGGYGDGKFGPNDKITREQFAAILYRYAKYKGYDVSVGEDTNVLSYNDAANISEWAIPSIQWACGAGLLNGDEKGNLLPAEGATRAQAATIFMRFSGNDK